MLAPTPILPLITMVQEGSTHCVNCTETENSPCSNPSAFKKVYKCSFPGCDKEFHLKGNLKRHETIHTGVKNFKCSFCDKAFFRKADMEVHHRVHTGEKPFQCKFEGCTKAFARKSDLRSHERTHIGKKPFVCDEEGCGRAFARRFDLQKHKKMHEKKRQAPGTSPAQKKRKRLESHKSRAFGHSVVETPLENALLNHQTQNNLNPISNVSLTPFDLFGADLNLTCSPAPTNQTFNASSSAGALEMLLRDDNGLSQEVKQPFMTNDAAVAMPPLDLSKIMEEVSINDGAASSAATSSLTAGGSMPSCGNLSSFIDYSVHSPSCGHLSIHHGNHLDYVVNNHLICQNSVKKIKPFHTKCPSQGEIPNENQQLQQLQTLKPQQTHRPGCGHLPVRHKDHIDYVVEDNLFCQHEGLILDETADKIELLDDDFWEFYGAIGSMN